MKIKNLLHNLLRNVICVRLHAPDAKSPYNHCINNDSWGFSSDYVDVNVSVRSVRRAAGLVGYEIAVAVVIGRGVRSARAA